MAKQALEASVKGAVRDVADGLYREFMGQPFGIIRFWGFAVVRPNDQSYLLTALHPEGDRLDLDLVHESGQGEAGRLSVWGPEGLESIQQPGRNGIVLRSAARIRFGDREAWLVGDRYRVRTPKGEGDFAVGDSPALTLAR